MNRFVKIFQGCKAVVESNINETARKRNLNIVSVSVCINQGIFYATVIYEKGATDERN